MGANSVQLRDSENTSEFDIDWLEVSGPSALSSVNVVLPRFRPRNILSTPIREQAAELHFRQRTGRLIPRSNLSCPRI